VPGQPGHHIRQTKVEHDNVGRRWAASTNPFLAAGRLEHPVAIAFQSHSQQSAHLDFVVND